MYSVLANLPNSPMKLVVLFVIPVTHRKTPAGSGAKFTEPEGVGPGSEPKQPLSRAQLS